MLMRYWPFGRRHRHTSGISIDRENAELREQLSRSVRRVRISRRLLGLAWSAGPVTAIGLYGGYYFAFGQAPTTQYLTYFVTFTLLTGVLALLAKIVYDGTTGFANRQARRNSDLVIDRLGELILGVRDLAVSSLEGESRRRQAAMQLLERTGIPAGTVSFACRELTGDPELSELLAQIDVYRRAGLVSRIEDIKREHSSRFDAAIAELYRVAPAAAAILRQRYRGEVAGFRHGVPRTDYFLERVLAAIEQDNLLLVTMQDVEAMLTLAFELINGREIRVLVFSYQGQWRLAAALDRMERRRSRYRIAQAAAGNRVRALASWLVEVGIMHYEEVPDGLSVTVLTERVGSALDRLARQLNDMAARYEKGETDLRHELRENGETMATALRLYRMAHDEYRRIGRIHADFLVAARNWSELLATLQTSPEELEPRPGRRQGLRIVEKPVALEDEQRKEVCRHLADYLRRHGLRISEHDDSKPAIRGLTHDRARELAVEVALALEPHVHLSFPEVQRGIDASLASYLGGLEPGMSVQEKRLLGESMAQDVVETMGGAAEQLAVALVRHYGVRLTEQTSNYLESRYGARRSVLDILRQHEPTPGASQSLLTGRPAIVPVARRRWYRSLVRVRRLVGNEWFTPLWQERL